MKNFFKRWLPEPRYLATFYMKSGNIINVNCSKIKIEYNGNQLTSYSMDGIKPGQVLFISITQIEAITYIVI